MKRLGLLKTLNQEIEQVYKDQQEHAAQMQQRVAQVEEEHNNVIENDEEKIQYEIKLKELEKTFVALRTEVENVASQNEKLRIQKDERLARDLNSRAFAERKNNDILREQVKEAEEKRQHQRDQERDYNRDIYQLAKEYQRKVDEFKA